MPLYDSADMLAGCREHAQLPVSDESMDDPAWYRLLTVKQAKWMAQVAAVFPDPMLCEPVKLEPFAGSGNIFWFGTDDAGRSIVPVGAVRLYRSESDAQQPGGPVRWALRPGVHFTHDGDRVRFSDTSPTYLPDGAPWARFVAPAGTLDATHQPVLSPVETRELVVLDAVVSWASQGNLRDPSPWKAEINDLWKGTGPGSLGLLGALRQQYWASASPMNRRVTGARSGPRGF